ncbi:MAG TPA: TIGR01777 family oxidoreductase [Pirellulales bacterium]
MRALVTGATGFVGRRLLERLDRPIVLSRDANRARQSLAKYDTTVLPWNPMADQPPPLEAFEGVDTVFNLAGEPVAEGRWTKAKKHRIRESRVAGTHHLVQAIERLTHRPLVLVSASAVGYYGSRGGEILTESATSGNDFLAEVCAAWEEKARTADGLGVRVVYLRTGIVLGPHGGALKKMLPPFKLGLGGPLGSGRQWVPWIHLNDLVEMYLFAAAHVDLNGPVNGVAPNPVTNKQFTKSLAAAVHRPAILPVPYPAVRIAFGEIAKVLFGSQRAVPSAALAHGFKFRYETLDAALRGILQP